MKTCGECKHVKNDFCDVFYVNIKRVDNVAPACPAFDDGSFDKAVDDLLRAAAEYLEVGTSSFRDSLEEAIEAVRVAKEESGK